MITLVQLFPVLLIGVLHWLMPSLVPPTVPFGVRVPRDHADEPVIARQRRRYRGVTAVVTVAAVAGVLLAHGHPQAVPAAAGAELLAGLVLYLHARRRITVVKVAEDWFGGRRQVATADSALRTDPERYPWAWAVPPVVLTAATVIVGAVAYPGIPARIPTHFGADGRPDHYAARSLNAVFGPVLAQVLTTALLLAVAWLVVRSAARLDAEDPQASRRHRMFVSAIARGLLALTVGLDLTFLFVSLSAWDLLPYGNAVAALATLPSMAGVVALIAVVVRTGQGGARLPLGGGPAMSAAVINRDDDRLYRWGLIYFNADDPALFVPKRFGVGWTVNMARPIAWVLLAGFVAALALPPLLH